MSFAKRKPIVEFWDYHLRTKELERVLKTYNGNVERVIDVASTFYKISKVPLESLMFLKVYPIKNTGIMDSFLQLFQFIQSTVCNIYRYECTVKANQKVRSLPYVVHCTVLVSLVYHILMNHYMDWSTIGKYDMVKDRLLVTWLLDLLLKKFDDFRDTINTIINNVIIYNGKLSQQMLKALIVKFVGRYFKFINVYLRNLKVNEFKVFSIKYAGFVFKECVGSLDDTDVSFLYIFTVLVYCMCMCVKNN